MKGEHWRQLFSKVNLVSTTDMLSYKSFLTYRISDWRQTGYKFNNPHSQHFQRVSVWGFFGAKCNRLSTPLDAECMRVGDSNWMCCTAFCACMSVSNSKETGCVVCRDTMCKYLQAGSRFATCFWAYAVEVLSHKDVNSHCAAEWKKDSVDYYEQIF